MHPIRREWIPICVRLGRRRCPSLLIDWICQTEHVFWRWGEATHPGPGFDDSDDDRLESDPGVDLELCETFGWG